MEINWIGPLLPDRTDIAGFTARLLPSLAARAQINLFSENPKLAKLPKALSGVRVFPLDNPDWVALNHADYSVFNIGNNYDFHARTYACLEGHSGNVILHDHCLHQFFDAWLHQRSTKPLIAHRDWVLQCHGVEAAEAIDRVHRNEMSLFSVVGEQPLNDPVLRRAKSIICHSAIVEKDSRRFGLPTLQLQLPYPAPYSRETLKHCKGSRRNRKTLEVLAFGYLGNDSRCLTHAIEAIARIPKGQRVRLTLVGWIQPGYRDLLKQRIRLHRLESRVRIGGFVPDRRLDALIIGSDLVLNLRNPSLGEASGSQLRTWSCGTASVVSDAGWYSGLPDNTCVKVASGQETDLLETIFLQALSDPDFLAHQGWAGYERLVSHHSCEAYVAGLIQHLCNCGRSLHPMHNHVARRFGRFAAAQTSGHSELDLAWIDRVEVALDSFLGTRDSPIHQLTVLPMLRGGIEAAGHRSHS